jgi:molybdopterin biosynthesis enzyme
MSYRDAKAGGLMVLDPEGAKCWTSSPGVEDWVPVTLTPVPADRHADGLVVATPIRHGSGSVSRLMRAHAWWPIPIGQGKFARGEHIDVQLIPGDPP